MHHSDLRDVPLVRTPREEDLHRARLAVCHHAESVDEARTFLQMLGLLK